MKKNGLCFLLMFSGSIFSSNVLATFSNAPAPLTLPFTYNNITYTDMLAWNSVEGFTYFWYYAAPTHKMRRIDTTSNNIKSWATGEGGYYAYMSRVSYRPDGTILSNWYWGYGLRNLSVNYFGITGNGGPKEFTNEYIYTTQPIYELDGNSIRFDTNWIKWNIVINSLSGGEVTGENVSCNVDTSSACNYNNLKNTSVALTATPKSSNYAFFSWKINGGEEITDNPLTLVLDSNKNVEAEFYKTFRDVVSEGFYEPYDPQNPEIYGDGQCVTYVRHETGIIDISGNANAWYQGAINAGYYTTGGPNFPGDRDMNSAIIVFGRVSDESFPYGHVGIIINKVDSTHLNIRDANWNLDGKLDEHVIDVANQNYNILGYVYYRP